MKQKLVNRSNFKTKLRIGDEVVVVTGKDVGKKGKIERILKAKNAVIVQGLNMVKKHKRSQEQIKKPEIVDIAAPIHISNVMLVDPETKKPTRIGFRFENGKKVRFARRSGVSLKEKKDAGTKEAKSAKETKKAKSTKEVKEDTK